MSTTRTRKRSRSGPRQVLQKPAGVIHPRVQKVGPEHFGIVSVDCAKARSKWMLCDFYGKVLVPPTVVEHNRIALTAATTQLRQVMAQHGLHDLIVASERTGRYHHPTQRAFAAAGFEVRIVHPFATKQFRQASDPGIKTDDTDMAAIHLAAVNGFALIEPPRDDTWEVASLAGVQESFGKAAGRDSLCLREPGCNRHSHARARRSESRGAHGERGHDLQPA